MRSTASPLALALIALALCGACEGAWAKRVALLVGVNAYPGLPAQAQLHGATNDVDALQDVLTRRWGFERKDIVVLKDERATKAGILGELRALQQRSTGGDEVFIYFSGHGTSAIDPSAATFSVPHSSGAFVPHDFRTSPAREGADGLIIGRTDLLPLLSELDAGGRKMWVVSDSCFSGQQVRSIQLKETGEMPSRMIPMVVGKESRSQGEKLDRARDASSAPPYPYRNIAYISASAEGEVARDVAGPALAKMPTLDGKPHGAMTDALLRVLDGRLPADFDGDGQLSLVEVHRAVADFMAQRAYGHTPQRLPSVAEDEHGLGQRPVLAMRGVVAQVQRAALEPLRLRISSVGGKALSKAHLNGLRQVPDAKVVGPDDREADLVLRISDTDLVIMTASGDLLRGMSGDDVTAFTGQIHQLAWAKRIRQLADQNRRGALPFEVDPANVGGNFRIGESLAFVVRPDRAATVLLLNINAEGGVSVLYPYDADERRPLAAQRRQLIPGQGRIDVTAPEGMDMQFAFAFDAPLKDMEWLTGLTGISAADGRLRLLEEALQKMKGRFTFATSETRALKAGKPS